MNNIEYLVIRSDRKTVGLQIKNGVLTVRAPRRLSEKRIEEIIAARRQWIEKHLSQTTPQQSPFTEEELAALTAQAKEYIPARVAHFAALMGVTFGKVTIRKQRTRWGSCSSKGNLNFNCLLMLVPPEVADSIVIHELCHLKEMNHSKAFYAEVLKYCPLYFEHRGWLKSHGKKLIARL